MNKGLKYRGQKVYHLFVLLGFLASWFAAVVLAESTVLDTLGLRSHGVHKFVSTKPFYYYVFHALGILCMLFAGWVAILNGNGRYITKKGIIAFFVIQVSALVWALITVVSSDNYGFMEMLGSTGAFVWFVTVLVFAGVDPTLWRKLESLIVFLAYVTALLLIYSIISESNYIWVPGASKQLHYFVIYWWLGAWVFLTPDKKANNNFTSIGKLLLVLVMLFVSLYIQSRTWTVLTLSLIPLKMVIASRGVSVDKQFEKKLLIVPLIAILLAFLYFVLGDIAASSIEGIKARLYEDSRSSQYVYFFESVSPIDLFFGLGPDATWYWPGIGDYQYIDNSLLWMAFIGGVPLAFSYVLLVIIPGITAMVRGASHCDAVAAALLSLFALMSIGFVTYMSPALSMPSYLIYLMAGRCYYLEFNRLKDKTK